MSAAERLLSALIALCAAAGLACHLCASDRAARRATFLYYTNLSNLLFGAYHALRLALSFFPESGAARALGAPGTELGAAACIAVTGILYWVALAPGAKRRGETLAAGRAANLLLHSAVPALGVLWWVLFADKCVSLADALWWLTVPAAYCAFILVRARNRGAFPGRSSAYPYHFMNPDRLGAARFARNLALIAAGFAALGLAFFALARALG